MQYTIQIHVLHILLAPKYLWPILHNVLTKPPPTKLSHQKNDDKNVQVMITG